jgi:hypothetical protein
MAKQGQHRNDAHDNAKSKGNNNPDKSVTIVTGTPKKQESYEKDVYANRDPYKPAQAKKNEWNEDTRDKPTIEGSPRARSGDISVSGRANGSGSDSNASNKTRGG